MDKFIFVIVFFLLTKVSSANTVYSCQMKESIKATEFDNTLSNLENFSFKK